MGRPQRRRLLTHVNAQEARLPRTVLVPPWLGDALRHSTWALDSLALPATVKPLQATVPLPRTSPHSQAPGQEHTPPTQKPHQRLNRKN